MKRASIAVAACAFALILSLAGCGGLAGSSSSTTNPAAESKAAFAGTWDLSGMDDNGEITSADDIALLKGLGLDVYLQLDEDGTATLDLFGERETGTWTPGTATAAKVTLDGQTVDMTIADDTLSMEQDGAKLEFTKGKPREAESSSNAGSSSSSDSSSSSSSGSAS